MINHRHKDMWIRHAVDRVCKACDLEVAAYNMEQKIDKVRELHKDNGWGECSVCLEGIADGDPMNYPCDTIKALDGEQ